MATGYTPSGFMNMTQDQLLAAIAQQNPDYARYVGVGDGDMGANMPAQYYNIPGIKDQVVYNPYYGNISYAENTGVNDGGTNNQVANYSFDANGNPVRTNEWVDTRGSGGWLSRNFSDIAPGVIAGIATGGLDLYSALGKGILGAAGTGAATGALTNLIKGDSISQGAVKGAAGGAVVGAIAPYLNDLINNIAGLQPNMTDAAYMQLDANDLVSQGITGQQLKDILAQGYEGVDPAVLNRVTRLALEGADAAVNAAAATTPAGGQTNTNLTSPTGTNNAVTITGQTPVGSNVVGNVAGGLLTGNTNAANNNQVVVTGKTPAQLKAEADAAAAAASSIGVNANNQITVTGNKQVLPDSLTGLTDAQKAALAAGASGLLTNAVTGPAPYKAPTDLSGLTDAAKLAAGLLTGGAGTLLAAQQAKNLQATLNDQAAKIAEANKAAQPGYQFSPIGITTRFGNATPKFDANGKLIGYDYGATSDIAAQRDSLLKLSQQALPTTTDPTQIANNYIKQQQGLLAPSQQQDLAALQAQMAATGRSGLGTGATTGVGGSNALAATNPQLAAYYNSLAQQNSQLAANAPTYAQNLLNSQIGTSGTLFGQAQGLETAAQQPMQLGSTLGTAITAGTTNASNAAQLAAQQAAALQAEGSLSAAGVNTAAQRNLLNGLSNNSGFQNILNSGFNWLTGKINP